MHITYLHLSSVKEVTFLLYITLSCPSIYITGSVTSPSSLSLQHVVNYMPLGISHLFRVRREKVTEAKR